MSPYLKVKPLQMIWQLGMEDEDLIYSYPMDGLGTFMFRWLPHVWTELLISSLV